MAGPITLTYIGSGNLPTVYITLLSTDLGTTLLARSQTGVTNPYGATFKYALANLAQDTVARWDEGNAAVYTDEIVPVGIIGPVGPTGATGVVSGFVFPTGYVPAVVSGPEGSPNGTLAAAPRTVVVTPSGDVFVKSVGNDSEGWIQTQ